MILAIIAVGDDYINNCLKYLDKFKDSGYSVKVLTDKPELFNDYDVYHFKNQIFSYFEKILFPLKLMIEFESDVLYVDADWIQSIGDEFIKNFKGNDTFLYYTNWPYGDKFKDYPNNEYFKLFIEYLKSKNFNYDNLTTIMEWVYYFPNIKNVKNILRDIEMIKPIFEYISIQSNNGYIGIGNGEGIGLSYVLEKNDIKIELFKDIHV
jgi:hypothetical protein